MVLEVIYTTRHGFRSTWVVDPSTGTYSTTILSPTKIPSDPPLAGYGQEQARQLADRLVTLEPAIERVYSSPFYRCLQTIEPAMKRLVGQGKEKNRGVTEIRGENGIGEWYGTARFSHPSPAPPSVLHSLFPLYSLTYSPTIIPSTSGETIDALHNRTAYALARIISQVDAEEDGPKAILLCSHAATLIAIGRALTGQMPEDTGEKDFMTYTCELNKFVRRRKPSAETASEGGDLATKTVVADQEGVPHVEWRDGKGVGGGWDCEINGDCSFLSNGPERGWHFSGDEAFSTSDSPATNSPKPSGDHVDAVGPDSHAGEKVSSTSRL